MSKIFTILMVVFVLGFEGSVLAQGAPPVGGSVGISPMVGAPTDLVQAAGSGIASKYWVRFMADSTPTLWLNVDSSWRQMNNPSASVIDAVQDAFCGCTNPLEVFVGYQDNNLTFVVVRSK